MNGDTVEICISQERMAQRCLCFELVYQSDIADLVYVSLKGTDSVVTRMCQLPIHHSSP